MTVKTDDAADFLVSSAEAMGVSCAAVRDGHVFVFTRCALEGMLAKITGDKVVVFVKHPPTQG